MGCGHAVVQDLASSDAITAAYADAADPVSLREEEGQVKTAHVGLEQIEAHRGGRGALLDVGCWTGSFLVAATDRGWHAEGIEPSHWAAGRAAARGASVFVGELDDAAFPDGAFDAVVCCDVLEHLVDPGAAIDRFRQLLCDGGVLYLTVPDAGSRLARAMGRRWWAVLPMHLQYFNRTSMRELLVRHGFDVRQIRTHPKSFSTRYYTERLASFVPGIGPVVERTIGRTRLADRLIAPDFGDRMEVVAVVSRRR